MENIAIVWEDFRLTDWAVTLFGFSSIQYISSGLLEMRSLFEVKIHCRKTVLHLTGCWNVFSPPAQPGLVDKRTLQEQTALLLAVSCDHLSCVQCLLQAGADPDISSKNKDTPLYKGTGSTWLARNTEQVLHCGRGGWGVWVSGGGWKECECVRLICLSRPSGSVRKGERGHGEPPAVVRSHGEPAVQPGLDGPPPSSLQEQHRHLRAAGQSRSHRQPPQHLLHRPTHSSSSAGPARGPAVPHQTR